MVRVPGFEPGFPRWQRGVITATLHSRCSLQTTFVFLSVGRKRHKVRHKFTNHVPSFPVYFDILS